MITICPLSVVVVVIVVVVVVNFLLQFIDPISTKFENYSWVKRIQIGKMKTSALLKSRRLKKRQTYIENF